MVIIILGVKRRKGGKLSEVICKCGVKCHGYEGYQPRVFDEKPSERTKEKTAKVTKNLNNALGIR